MTQWTNGTPPQLGSMITRTEIVYKRKYWGLFGPKIAVDRRNNVYVCVKEEVSNCKEPKVITLKIYELMATGHSLSHGIWSCGIHYMPTEHTVVVNEIEYDLLSKGREIVKGPRVRLKPIFNIDGSVRGVYCKVNYGSVK